MFADTLTKTIADAQQQTLDTVASLQDKVIEWNKDAASTFGTWLGSSPIAAPIAPFAEKLVDPALVEQAFGFASELLAANRRFATGLIEAWTPKSAN